LRPFPPSGGGRREIIVVCPACQFRSSVPPAAVSRNAYFCSKCGKALDLMTQTYRPGGGTEDGDNAPPPPRRDRGTSKYKSARKGRR
jgi:hypothetical protein